MDRCFSSAAFVLVSMALFVAGGCGRSDAPAPSASQPAPMGAPASPAPPSAPAIPAAAPVPPPPPAANESPQPTGVPQVVPVVDGVPDLQLTWPSPKLVAESHAANAAGLKAHKKKDYKGAIKGYLDALRKNPSHLLARYNLACAYALQGDADRALGVLSQLKAAGCIACLKRLVRAGTDEDFASLKSDERFRKIVADVVVQEPDYKAAATAVGEALAAGRSALLEPSLEAGLFLTFEGEIEDMSGAAPRKVRSVLTNLGDLKKFVRQNTASGGEDEPLTGLHGDEVESCKDECCSLRSMCGGAMDTSSPISEICFWPASATTALPIRIRYMTCGGN